MRNGIREFFAAANTEEGFYSIFESVFPPSALDKIFIIKGGPGTGKSTLMRQIAEYACGRGYSPELYYCSSDTSSLDGIVIPERSCAVIDGTAPHMTDPKYPGACETIISLYGAFDIAALRKRRAEIIGLATENSELYHAAYRFLSAAGRVHREIEESALGTYNREKAAGAQRRLLRAMKLPTGRAGRSEVRYVDAIGTSGSVHLPTFEKTAGTVYTVSDKYGLGGYFLTSFCELCESLGISLVKCPSPLRRDRIESLYIKEADTLFYICRDEEKLKASDRNINILRFADKGRLSAMRRKLKFSGRCYDCLMRAAEENLAGVRRAHAALEAIYGENIDFSAVESQRDAILRDIFADNM